MGLSCSITLLLDQVSFLSGNFGCLSLKKECVFLSLPFYHQYRNWYWLQWCTMTEAASPVMTFGNHLIDSLLTPRPFAFGRSCSCGRQWMCKLLLLGGICRLSIFLNICLVWHGQVWCFSIAFPSNARIDWKTRKFLAYVAFKHTSMTFARMNSKYTVFYGLSRSYYVLTQVNLKVILVSYQPFDDELLGDGFVLLEQF